MSKFLSSLLLLGSLAGAAYAQTASYTFFGSGCSSFAPKLAVTGVPKFGTSFSVTMAYGTPPSTCASVVTSWTAFMVTGVSNQTYAGVRLPATLPQSCSLLASAEFLQMRAGISSGTACPPLKGTDQSGVVFQYSVPTLDFLAGVRLYQQMFLVRTTTSELWVGSNGGIATIGT